MQSLYNRVAGQSVERLAALTDGIFAVAMTLLVLDLRVPASETVHSEHDLGRVLLALTPRLTIFLMSMVTLGIFWVGQQTQLNHFERSDRNLAWIHIAFLCAVCLVPFSTSLLAEFIHDRMALLVHWFNILLLGVTLLWSWHYATRARLLADELPGEIHPAVVRRIVKAQTLYAGSRSENRRSMCGAIRSSAKSRFKILERVQNKLREILTARLVWPVLGRPRISLSVV